MGAGDGERVPPSAFSVDGEAGAGDVMHDHTAVAQPVSAEMNGKQHISLDLGGALRAARLKYRCGSSCCPSGYVFMPCRSRAEVTQHPGCLEKLLRPSPLRH